MIKTFRGLLADGGQNRIRLSTIKGKVGYRIVAFELIGNNPSATSNESIVKVWNDEQGADDGSGDPYGIIDFSITGLLAAGYYSGGSASSNPQDVVVIVDREIFNQDIYITHFDNSSDVPINFYLELEVIPLDDAGAEYTTLKDMRST